MDFCGCRILPQVVETNERSQAKCRAGAASPKSTHGVVVSCVGLGWCAFTQPQSPALAAREDLEFWWWRQGEGMGRGSSGGICEHEHLLGQNWWNFQEFNGSSVGFWFLYWKKLLDPPQRKSLEIVVYLNVWLIVLASKAPFFLVLSCLDTSQLYWSEGR